MLTPRSLLKRPLSGLYFALGALAVVASSPVCALAQDAPELLTQDNANILWTLVAAILVMFMQAGFALVEAGFTRAKNAGNILMKNFVDFAAGSIVYFLIGFGFMFGDSISGFIGGSGFALGGADASTADGMWTLTFWFFQSVFAATAATIVSGGMAERTKFSSYILASILVTGLIYPVAGHWAWGGLWGNEGGWLEAMGFIDFAGSTVVHSVGGWSLWLAHRSGPRVGKYTPTARQRHSRPQIPLAALGVFIRGSLVWVQTWLHPPCRRHIGFIAVNTSMAPARASRAPCSPVGSSSQARPYMAMNGALAGCGPSPQALRAVPVGAINPRLAAASSWSCSGLHRPGAQDRRPRSVRCPARVSVPTHHHDRPLAAPRLRQRHGLLYGGDFSVLSTLLIGVGRGLLWDFGRVGRVLHLKAAWYPRPGRAAQGAGHYRAPHGGLFRLPDLLQRVGRVPAT
jgi:Amt family ammonium transporter